MPIPSVQITDVQGALGVMPAYGRGDIAVVVGPSTDGPLVTPVGQGKTADVASNYGKGPLVSLASRLIKKTGKAVICVRTNITTDGACGAVDSTGVTGTSVPTADASVDPYDEYEAHIEVVTGGTIGSAGITYKWSLDGGRTQSAITSLGTANSITITAGNVKFDLAAGTLVAGDVFFCRTTPPLEDADDLEEAHTAIGETGLTWNFAVYANVVTAAKFAAIDTWLDTLWGAGKFKAARCNARGPNVGETEAQYLAAMALEFGATSSEYIALAAGYCEFIDAMAGSSRQLRRPASWATTCRALDRRVIPSRNDLGQVDLGPISADLVIRDANLSRKAGLHDEALDPGLDALGFETLYFDEDYNGVLCTTPHVFASVGSDNYLWQYRCVKNRWADAVRATLKKRCRKYVFVSAKTGYITKPEAKEINNLVDQAVRDAVGDSVSAASFKVSETDNLLAQNAKITGDGRMVPLAYPVGFEVTEGFVNPANGQTL